MSEKEIYFTDQQTSEKCDDRTIKIVSTVVFFFAFSFLNELNKSLKILNFLTETMMLQKLLVCLIALLTSTWVRAYMYYLISM